MNDAGPGAGPEIRDTNSYGIADIPSKISGVISNITAESSSGLPRKFDQLETCILKRLLLLLWISILILVNFFNQEDNTRVSFTETLTLICALLEIFKIKIHQYQVVTLWHHSLVCGAGGVRGGCNLWPAATHRLNCRSACQSRQAPQHSSI